MTSPEMDPTQRGDEVAAAMRDYYEAHKPLHWWQRRRRYESECADDLMLGLLTVALSEWEARA